jgi:hypothetical protein
MPLCKFYTICWTYWRGLQIQWDKKIILSEIEIFEVFTEVNMKDAIFWDIETQFIPHTKHITSQLQSQQVNAM